jgi:large subunit ribosomal protein L9
MKVVLLQSVDNLGQAGNAVEVKRGYFRNFLEPRSMALQATRTNLKLVENRRKKLDSLVAKEKGDAEQIKAILDGKSLTFELRAGDRGQLYGSVSSRDVVEAIKNELNVEIERRRIDMDILKSLGDHPVRIRVYPEITANLTVTIERLKVEGQEDEEELEGSSAEGFFIDYDDELGKEY